MTTINRSFRFSEGDIVDLLLPIAILYIGRYLATILLTPFLQIFP